MDQAFLKSLFEYHPETGYFIRRCSGRRAGTISSTPTHNILYRQIMINGRQYREHRLAFLYMTGKMPPKVDHRNRNGLDNSWKNLRASTHGQNMANRIGWGKLPKGVYPITGAANRWQAVIVFNKKRIYLGCFTSIEEAAAAYNNRAKELFGEFALTSA